MLLSHCQLQHEFLGAAESQWLSRRPALLWLLCSKARHGARQQNAAGSQPKRKAGHFIGKATGRLGRKLLQQKEREIDETMVTYDDLSDAQWMMTSMEIMDDDLMMHHDAPIVAMPVGDPGHHPTVRRSRMAMENPPLSVHRNPHRNPQKNG